MEIKNIGLAREDITGKVVINKIKSAHNLIPEEPAQKLGKEGVMLPKNFLDVSLEILKFFRIIKDDFGVSSLLFSIKELLVLLSSLKEGLFNQETVNLINKIKAALSGFKDLLSNKEVSSELIRNIIDLHINSKDLQMDFAKLISAINDKQAGAVVLKLKVENFVNYLETLYFLNQRNISADSTRPGFLYFPFTITLENNQEGRVELLIYPEIDEENKVNHDIISFAISVETQSLGRMGLFFKIVNSDVSCNIAVENSLTKEIIEDNKDYLIQRLKEMKLALSGFGCRIISSPEELEECLFLDLTRHLELKA